MGWVMVSPWLNTTLYEFLAECAVAEQNVDGQLFELIFVRRLLPGKIVRVLVEDVLQKLHRHVETAELVAVEHVDLRTATNLASALVERGLEIVLAEVHTGELEPVHVLAELDRIDERRAENLEGARGATAFAHVGRLEQTHARVNDGGIERGHVRARQNPRESRLVVPHLFVVAFHAEHIEFALREAFFLELHRKFANRLRVARADAVQANETRVVQVEYRTSGWRKRSYVCRTFGSHG